MNFRSQKIPVYPHSPLFGFSCDLHSWFDRPTDQLLRFIRNSQPSFDIQQEELARYLMSVRKVVGRSSSAQSPLAPYQQQSSA